MSGKHGPPKGKPWIWQSQELLDSFAWRSIGINGRRLLDFLMLEHMKHGGQDNGRLLAPREQLEAWGIGARHISGAIAEVETCGLVDVRRGARRRPNLYTLNWLPLHDGSEPSMRWRATTAEGKSKPAVELLASEGKSEGYPKGSQKGRYDFRREVIRADFKGIRREAPLKKFLPGSSVSTDLDEEEVMFNRMSAGMP